MHIVIRNPANGRRTDYTMPELAKNARAMARLAGCTYRHHWVEVIQGASSPSLCAEVTHPDGRREILREVI